jgi:ribose 5-phosphate isomerase B
MKIGLAADHGGFELKEILLPYLKSLGHEIKDFGAFDLNNLDDYPDFVIPLAKAVVNKEVERGIAVCGSGVGACVAVNKIPGVRAALINDPFSAHQGVEDDDLNIMCLGGRITGFMVAREYVKTFLDARFTNAERHLRRLQKVTELEMKNKT